MSPHHIADLRDAFSPFSLSRPFLLGPVIGLLFPQPRGTVCKASPWWVWIFCGRMGDRVAVGAAGGGNQFAARLLP